MSVLTNNLDNNNQKDNLTDRLLMKVADRFGNEWEHIAIGDLGFNKHDVDQFSSDGTTHQKRVFNMLHAWKCREKPARIKTLIQILNKANIHPDVLELLKNENNSFNELRCTCCQKYDCSCNCKPPEIIVSNSEPGGYNHTIKISLMETYKISEDIPNTLNNIICEKDPQLFFKLREIINRLQFNLLKISPGCIELKLQLRSYEALLNLTQLCKREASKGITQLAPLHQKLRDALMEELPCENIMPAMFSFQNIFEGGSYKSALEFFCAGFSLDDMLPILKKHKFQNIDYLCIDVKGAPQTTLTDLKKEFIKKRDRKLRAIRKKLKNKLGVNDSKFIIRLIDNVLNKAGKNQGRSCKRTREQTGKKRKKIQHETLRKPEDSCMFEIPGRTMQQPQSFLISYKPPLKLMTFLNYIKQKEMFEKVFAAQLKSKEKNVKTKKKQRFIIICCQTWIPVASSYQFKIIPNSWSNEI
ncbi:uncharacterized protein LOC116983580 [Amblyraja radiata]|uniref:uncharacterized protein LOC116983580 n=1 Tax=Amblyraja radiata TaxID=386614 RepID=UPI0014040F2C|nr:uncharacterized protein LOC116983580 [Amblyraja radiata]